MAASGNAITTAPLTDQRMKSAMTFLSGIFSSKVRASVLVFLVTRSDRRFSLTELARELGLPVSSLQHECYKLERLNVIKGRREGLSRRYRVLTEEPTNVAMVQLVVSALGMQHATDLTLSDLVGVSGAVVVDAATYAGDDKLAYLVLVGDVDLAHLDVAHARMSTILGIPPDALEVAFFVEDEWAMRAQTGNPVLQRLQTMPTIAATGALQIADTHA